MTVNELRKWLDAILIDGVTKDGVAVDEMIACHLLRVYELAAGLRRPDYPNANVDRLLDEIERHPLSLIRAKGKALAEPPLLPPPLLPEVLDLSPPLVWSDEGT